MRSWWRMFTLCLSEKCRLQSVRMRRVFRCLPLLTDSPVQASHLPALHPSPAALHGLPSGRRRRGLRGRRRGPLRGAGGGGGGRAALRGGPLPGRVGGQRHCRYLPIGRRPASHGPLPLLRARCRHGALRMRPPERGTATRGAARFGRAALRLSLD
jgi:hypothetical protein